MRGVFKENERICVEFDDELGTNVIDLVVEKSGSFIKPKQTVLRNNKIFIEDNPCKITRIVIKKHCSCYFLKKFLPEIFNFPYMEF